VSILSRVAWPWTASACVLTILLNAALVMRWQDRRRWARDPVFQQHRDEWRQRAEVARCVALDTCPYPAPYGCGDACGAEQPRAEAAAGTRTAKGRHRAQNH
jgi:hypothetical protein